LKLHISDNLSLPLEAVTQTFAVLAKRGKGKTYCASVMAEEMLKAKQQIVAVDPTGAWWGLRSGFPVVVFGGEHADVPLEESAGEVIARAIVEHRFPAVIDLSLFRKGAMMRFMTAFGETLYRLNREPLHLFIDEADAFAPQGRSGFGVDENRMLGAMEDIVRRGRKRGIGCTLITQRPAVLNKNVLTQAESLIALGMSHPKDIDAIREWVNVHAEPETAQQVEDDLPTLPVGTAWFWSPGWMGELRKIQIRKRETFDSSATPKPGESPRKPKTLAEIDLSALGEQIKQTVEKAKADDPRELRKRIAELERKLRERPAEQVQVEKIVRVPVLENGQLDRTDNLAAKMEAAAHGILAESAELRRLIQPAFAQKEKKAMTSIRDGLAVKGNQGNLNPRPAFREPVKASVGHSSDILPRGEAAMLRALIQFPNGLRREQLTVLTGYKRSSRDAYLSRLRERGYAELGDICTATKSGVASLPDAEPLPTGEALREYWLARLPQGERAIFQVLLERYPEVIDRTALDEMTEYKRSSRDAYLSRLAAKELIEEPARGQVRASSNLFE